MNVCRTLVVITGAVLMLLLPMCAFVDMVLEAITVRMLYMIVAVTFVKLEVLVCPKGAILTRVNVNQTTSGNIARFTQWMEVGVRGRLGISVASRVRRALRHDSDSVTVLRQVRVERTVLGHRERRESATDIPAHLYKVPYVCLPACKRLRRPYQGSMMCTEIPEDEGSVCLVSCPSRYAFSGPVFPVYHCGRSTGYLWPHQTPDNPRCIIPACTKTSQPESILYHFQSPLNLPCQTSRIPSELLHLLDEKARYVTRGLHCMRHHTCTLRSPSVRCCSRTSAVGNDSWAVISGSGIDCEEDQISVERSRRALSHGAVSNVSEPVMAVEVVLVYHGRHDMRRKETDILEVSRLGERLLKETRAGILKLDYGRQIIPDINHTQLLQTVVCHSGSMLAADGQQCVECSAGTYYKVELSTCVPCEVGYYQFLAKQTTCMRCPGEMTTLGRGAVLPQECYEKNKSPPDIADQVYERLETIMSRPAVYRVIPITVISVLVILTVIIIIIMVCRSRNDEFVTTGKDDVT